MGRQPNGRPTIYLGKDGRYHCYATIGQKPDGRLNRKHFAGKTATAVAADYDNYMAQLAAGRPVVGKSETVAEWLVHWLENIVKPSDRAYKTYRAYHPIVHLHLIPYIGRWRIDGLRNRLEPEHIEAMQGKLKKKLALSYRQQVHAVLHKALVDAMRRGRATRNAAALVDPPTGRKKKVRAHTLAEAQAIVQEAVGDPRAARWLIGIMMGPRQGEVLGIHWSGDDAADDVSRFDLDAEPVMLYLRQQLQRRTWEHGCADAAACVVELAKCRRQACPPRYVHGCADPAACKGHAHFCPDRAPDPDRGCSRHQRACPPLCPPGCTDHARWCPARRGGGLVEVDLKTDESSRDLAVPTAVVPFVLAAREAQQRDCDERGVKWDPRGLAFTGPGQTPKDPRADHEDWEDLLRRAGVVDTPLHAGRHTAGTIALASGTDSRVIQDQLGHASAQTMKVYVEVANKLKKEAVDRVAAMLFDGALSQLLQPVGATKTARS